MHDLLVHRSGDHVGVAIRDIRNGETIVARNMDDGVRQTLTAREDAPLGHKIALANLPVGADVIEYGVRIGRTSSGVRRGDWIHVHNVKSARWA